MITARRMHEHRARVAAGLPEPPPRLPDFIPYQEHETALYELRKKHAAELKAAGGGAPTVDSTDDKRVAELQEQVEGLEGELGAALGALAAEVGMAEIRNVRRFYLHKRLQSVPDDANVWQAKQEAEPGTPLAADFPLKADLAKVGYTTEEDLDGADQAELERAGFKSNQAKKIIAALG
jgi:hypothetical protein